jgi:hypothetical protein
MSAILWFLNDGGISISLIGAFVDIDMRLLDSLLDSRDGVDISEDAVVGVDISDAVLADGNPLKIDLHRPSRGSLPASTTPVSFTKSGAEREYSPLLS